MLKKRILASTMASVMALGSVSLVAFADDKVEAPKTEAITKAQLEKYLEDKESFIEEKLDDYGSTLSEQFEDAYEAAEAVVDDKDADAEDATAAYQMLKAVEAKLVHHTVDELADLVKDYKTERETENINNSELNDLIWKDETFNAFEDAYDVAKDSLEETDQRAINDAYADLEAAINGLDDNDYVTRREFVSTYNKFVKITEDFKDYEDWRRGKATVGVNSGKLDNNTDDDDGALSFEGKTVDFGTLKDIIYGSSKIVPQSLKKAYNRKFWINGASASQTVQEFVDAQRKRFLEAKSAEKTTDGNIVKAYKAARDAVKVFEGWQVDNVKKSSKSSCENLIDDYRSKIIKSVYGGVTASSSGTAPAKLLDAIKSTATSITADANGKVTVQLAAKATIKINTDTETGKIKVDDDGAYVAYSATPSPNGVEVTIGASDSADAQDIDITEYLPLNAALIDTKVDDAIATELSTYDDNNNNVSFADAIKTFEALVKNEAADPQKDWNVAMSGAATTLNTNGAVTENSGKSAAYQLAYRAMAYALADAYPSADEYSRNDVDNLLDKAEEILVQTYDSATFEANNTALDKVWRAATEWVAAAKKTKGYKSSTKVIVDGKYLNDNSTVFLSPKDNAKTTGLDATTVYKDLNDAYKDLKEQLEDYKYSYGDIAATINKVAEGLDDNAYGASTDKIKAAVADVAYRLATLSPKNKTDNVFDDDRNYIAYNRLNNAGNDGEKTLFKNYEALLAAMEEATAAPAGVAGDVDNDGKVTTKDAKMVLNGFLDKITLTADEIARADMDGDGSATLADAKAIIAEYLKA